MQQKLCCFIFFLTSFSTLSFSQESVSANNQSYTSSVQYISISYGTLTPDYLLDGYHPGRPTEFDYANKGMSGPLCISYKYKLGRRLYLGVTGTVEQQNGNWQDNEVIDGNPFDLQTTVKGAFVRTDYTIAAEFKYDYIVSGIYRQYMVAGIGGTTEFETDQYNPAYYNRGYYNGNNIYGPMRAHNNRVHLNSYFSPLGFSIGRKVRYFLEIGFGYKGVINTGISYKF